jgi:di/tricarboxylate transporter
MPTPILLTLILLGIAAVLFITERLSMDLVALLALAVLALTGLVTPTEALSGFSNPAVVTIWATFILSAGLTRTGIAGWIGRLMVKFSGKSEARLLLVIMLAGAFLSAFMNNIAVTAMLLPVVLDISRRTHRPPSKLLIPLVFSAHLGGLTTLIGTPSNILVSNALQDFGLLPFGMFDFAPMGIIITLAGILYLLIFSRRLLPSRHPVKEFQRGDHEMGEAFAIEERLFVISIPEESALQDKTLAESHLGSALGVNVVGIRRHGKTDLAPDPQARLHANDRLLVTGRPDRLLELLNDEQLVIDDQEISLEDLVSEEIKVIEVGLSTQSKLIGHTLEEVSFRQRYGGIVLAVWRGDAPLRTNLETVPLERGDILLIQGTQEDLDHIRQTPDFLVSVTNPPDAYRMRERLMLIGIPEHSSLAGKTLIESHMGDAYGLGVMGIIRTGKTHLMPEPTALILAGDTLIVKGRRRDLAALRALSNLEIDYNAKPSYTEIETDQIGMVEVVLSPQSSLAGKSLRVINFRERFGLTVLGIWRGGHPHRFNIRDIPLRFGDALLVFGDRQKLRLLAQDPEFLVLTEKVQAPPRLERAAIAALLMLGVVALTGLGALDIAIAAVTGAALMVLTGCLTMNEAYQAIEWRAIFLIAGMLPLGTAMQTSGTTQFLADTVGRLTAPYGITIQLLGLFLLATLATQVMPNPVVTVLMAPIALTTAAQMGYNPQALLMVITIAVSSNFLNPVSHPANVLIMGPGGYKFSDYIKSGLPLLVLIILITLFVLPTFWPLFP